MAVHPTVIFFKNENAEFNVVIHVLLKIIDFIKIPFLLEIFILKFLSMI